ncbi:MAG: hypothetical protein II295_05060, partial [Akkermansia sp.]|nr:hypothetical protein [Akkermansia sp.]
MVFYQQEGASQESTSTSKLDNKFNIAISFMWRFLLKFMFITSASIALGQQSVIVTFGSGNNNDNTREGDTYNIISRKNDNGYSSFSGLKCTDGTTAPITISVGLLYSENNLIQNFSGTSNSIALINETFNNTEIHGFTNIPTNQTIITFKNVEEGYYTLSVLVANGTTPSAISAMTYLLCDKDNHPLANVTANIIASNVSQTIANDTSLHPAVTNNGTAVTAYAAGSNKTATDWALIEYSFELTNELNTIKLRSSSTYGNVAAIKLTSI